MARNIFGVSDHVCEREKDARTPCRRNTDFKVTLMTSLADVSSSCHVNVDVTVVVHVVDQD